MTEQDQITAVPNQRMAPDEIAPAPPVADVAGESGAGALLGVPEQGPIAGADPAPSTRPRPGTTWWSWPVVGLIAAIAGLGYGWGANSDGVEMYYVGAVRTMSHSWRAFFFGGFDPAGGMTMDKLPGSFWIQALVVRGFGLHTWCFIAPQIAAGVGTVIVMFVAVRRLAGSRTGILAAVITAALPATAVMSRGNTADAISVFLMVLAAATATKAIRTGRLRTLIIAGIWIGLAFQSKMIEAWAIVPALLLTYLVCAPGSLGRRLRIAGVAGVVMIVVSLSYMTAVQLTPAHDRPYVDGSTNNSIFQQVFEYNGVHRLGAGSGAYGLAGSYTPTTSSVAYTRRVHDEQIPVASVSNPGVFRLIRGPIGRDVGWLLPVALASLIALLIAVWRRPRTDPVRAGVLLWGGWLVTFTFVFSDATELESYYTGVLAPPIAALSALGLRTAYRALRKCRVRLPMMAAYALVGIGAVSAAVLLRGQAPRAMSALLMLALILAALGVAMGFAGRPRVRRAGTFALVVALLLAPAYSTVWLIAGHSGSFDAPFTPGGTFAEQAKSPIVQAVTPRPPTYGGVVIPQLDAKLWTRFKAVADFYNASHFAGKHLLVFTSAEASQFVAAGVTHVEVIGGYTGLIATPTVDELRAQLAAHKIDFAFVPGNGDERSADPRIQLIESTCFLIGGGDPETMAVQEYDCPSP